MITFGKLWICVFVMGMFSGCSWFSPVDNTQVVEVVVQEEQENRPVKVKSTQEFEQYLQSEQYLIADFFGAWCQPCKLMDPINERIAKKFPRVKIVKIDIDLLRDLTAKYGIMGVPTFIFFKDRKAVGKKVVGIMEESAYESEIKSRFGL